jgi:oligopeptide transport system substrate-binding protein
MSIKKSFMLAITMVVIGSIILSACATPEPEVVIETVVVTEVVEVEGEEVVVTEVVEVEVEVTPEPEEEPLPPVTWRQIRTSDLPTLDLQRADDVISIDMIENLFVHLTNYDLETADVVPEAATSWEASEDGLTWTFHLRTDIPWVYHNPVTGETTQEVDEEGNPRFVVAGDFLYGIMRACDPNLATQYSFIVGPAIKGCIDLLNSDPEEMDQELVDAVGVSAPSDDTLVIELEAPLGYFLTMTPMWTLAAAPQWAIEEHENDWIEAGRLVNNGRFVLSEWVHGVRWSLKRNPLMPADMVGEGNLEEFVISVVPDRATAYALWLNNDIDNSAIPLPELQAHLEQFPDETTQLSDLVVFYISFRTTKYPFDTPEVRRAFAAAFDSELYISQVWQGQGLAPKHFAPPGTFGAPPFDEVGTGFDPEFAREQLAAGGFPNCEGFPQVSFLGYSGQTTLDWLEFAQAQWEEHLGCPADLIQLEQQTFAELLDTTLLPDAEAPHMHTLGWGPDYPDENNWVKDVLWCENEEQRENRQCSEVDEWMEQAAVETDPEVRKQLYYQIEEALFGREGEMPFAPVRLRIEFLAQHYWADRIIAWLGGQQYYNWTIDQAAQLAAMGE